MSFSIFLGFIQGVSEFLPISSSGHLAIFQNLFGMQNVEAENLFFDVLLHLGTLIAVIVVYYKDIAEMIAEFFGFFTGLSGSSVSAKRVPPARRLLFLLIVATVPLVLVLLFKDFVETLYGNTVFIGCALLVTGLLLFISDRVRRGVKNEMSATWLDALLVGLLQVVAVIPGLSRSGTTIAVGIFRGFDRKFAVRFSFLMSIPAVLGANILSFKDALEAGIDTTLIPMYIAGVVTAAVFGYLAIRLVKFVADKGRFGYFAYYCWFAGIFAIIIALITGK